MQRIVVSTTNRGKVRELSRLFGGLRGVELLSLADFAPIPPVVEDGATFQENAIKKVWETHLALGAHCLADDSGLEVDALDGGPGLYSARFAGEGATDGANVQKLLRALQGVPTERRRARFRCVLAFVDTYTDFERAPGYLQLAEGICEGRIADAPRGDQGFGYDPVFVPEGYELTMAELPPETKDALSHRGQAARAMAAWLTSTWLPRVERMGA